MPWQCPQCSAQVGDDAVAACPACGEAKTAWTLVKDQTRTLRVGGGKRFVCERGADDAPPAAPLAAAYDAATWTETDVAPAIPTAEARRLAGAGQGPAPCDVLRVVQHPGKGPPSAVQLTTLPEARRTETTAHEARPGPPHDARLLLVFGEPPDGLTFDGLEVVDVTDDTPEGHAPQLEVTALKRPHRTLPIVPRAAIDWGLFSFDIGPDLEIDWDLFSFDIGPHDGPTSDEAPAATTDELDWGLFGFDIALTEQDAG